jgi:hypothetical protein
MIIVKKSENDKKYALVQEGKVINIVIWDGESEFNPEGDLVELPEVSSVEIDWDYIDGEFVDNRPKTEMEAL